MIDETIFPIHLKVGFVSSLPIYDGRSGYLHRGEVLYLSRPIRGGQKWDTGPTVGMIMGNRRFPARMKLPYSSWFQSLVRHCIMQFIAGQLNK
jgi:hypothetical protein